MLIGTGHEVFSAVTGGRPSSFQGVMDGGPPGSRAAGSGEQGGGWLPLCITPWNDQAGSLGTKEKASWPSCIMINHTYCKLHYALHSIYLERSYKLNILKSDYLLIHLSEMRDVCNPRIVNAKSILRIISCVTGILPNFAIWWYQKFGWTESA